MVLQAGAAIPAFKTKAAVSDREVSPETLKGRRAVLVLHGPRTADTPKQVGKAVRARWTSADDVVVANVVNLQSMAGLWKKVADAQIKATYDKMATKVTLGDPADYVVICPDYENAVATAMGFDDTNTSAAVVVVDDDGTIIGATDDSDLAEQVVAWLED